MFREEEIALAKTTVEAIKKISRNYYNSVSKLPGGGLSETEWEWEPEWLDPLLFTYDKYSGLYWFKCSDSSERFKGWIFILTKDIEESALHVPQKDCIPLLHWERIEGILEGMGYWLEVDKPLNKYIKKSWMKVHARIYEQIWTNAAGNGRYVSCAEAESRQEAAMRAVIELGERNNASLHSKRIKGKMGYHAQRQYPG